MAKNRITKHRNRTQAELPEEFDPELGKVLNDLPPPKREIVMQALVSQHYSGPLPDGNTIRVYGEVIPNGGDRLMTNVEKQLDHRMGIEKTGIRRSFNQSSTGQWMAFFIAFGFLLAAWDLAKSGREVTAAILGGIDLVALVAIFITGKISRK